MQTGRGGGLIGENILGLPKASQRAPNTSSLGRYLFVLIVVVIGAIYSAPNVFQPDPALQIKPEDTTVAVGPGLLARARAALTEAGIEVIGGEVADGSVFLRLEHDNSQLLGREIVVRALEGLDEHYVVALTRASTTPQWLQDLGAKPMSLGLDLSGGVHLLLQVDMEKFLRDRMVSMQETARDALVEARVRYVGREWVDGTLLSIPFRTAEARARAVDALAEKFDGFIGEKPRRGRRIRSSVHHGRGIPAGAGRLRHLPEPPEPAQPGQRARCLGAPGAAPRAGAHRSRPARHPGQTPRPSASSTSSPTWNSGWWRWATTAVP